MWHPLLTNSLTLTPMTYCSWETTNKIGKSYFYMTTRWGKWRKIYRNREFVRLFLKICCQKLPCHSGMLSKTISNHHTFDYYCWQFYLQPLNVIYEFIKKNVPHITGSRQSIQFWVSLQSLNNMAGIWNADERQSIFTLHAVKLLRWIADGLAGAEPHREMVLVLQRRTKSIIT